MPHSYECRITLSATFYFQALNKHLCIITRPVNSKIKLIDEYHEHLKEDEENLGKHITYRIDNERFNLIWHGLKAEGSAEYIAPHKTR